MSKATKMEVSTNLASPSGGTPSSQFYVPNVPKVTYQDPQSISSNYGWGLPVDFVLPKIGKVIDMVLQIDVTVTGTDPVYFPPTPMWFERLETSVGGSAPFETVNKDECLQETLMFLDVQDFQTIAPKCNINSDGSWKTSTALPVGTTRFFLPLWSNCLMTSQLFLKGFESDWRLRFILSQNTPHMGMPLTATTANITGLRLLLTEARMSDWAEKALLMQHQLGHVVYKTINRLRHLDTKVPGAGSTEFTLTTFGNDSAGVLTYFRATDNSTDYSKLGLRAEITSLNLRDANGNPYYATDLDGDFNLYFLSPWSVTAEPLADNRGKYNYLLPFSANVGTVLKDGRDLGAYRMSGKERIVINLSSAQAENLVDNLGTPVFVAISYDYMRINCWQGKASVKYNRS